MNLELKHSRIFIDKNFKLLTLSSCKTKILEDDTNIVGLLNIPTNPKLFKIHLLESNSKINNIKINIELDYHELKDIVKNKNSIPNKKELFFLIKKNYIGNPTYTNERFNKTYYHKKIVLKPEYYLKKDFIKINDLIFDTKNEEIYLEDTIDRSIYSEEFIFNTINSHPNMNLLNPIFKIKTKAFLVLHSKHNKVLLNNYLSILSNKKKIKTLLIDDLFKNAINNMEHETLILFDIEYSNKVVENIKEKIVYKNLIILNQKYNNPSTNNLNYIDNNCLDNVTTFNRSIINIKNNNIVLSRKIFKSFKNKNTKKFINSICPKQKILYSSLSENIVNYNNLQLKNYSLSNYKNINCSICLDKLKLQNLVTTNCKHLYCEKCIFKNLMVSNKCPQCRSHINTYLLFKNNSKYSNKINYIQTHIENNKKILVITNYKESIKTLQNIFTNTYHIKNTIGNKTSNLFLLDVRNLVTNTKFNMFDKILFLEDNYDHFDYYKYMLINNNSKKKIEILT